MPDLARNVRTGEICSAAELTVRVHLQADPFRCIDCAVAMQPVAVTPGTNYKVSPHFKVAGDQRHAADCNWDGRQVATRGLGRHDARAPRNPPGWLPDRLRPAVERPQAAPPDAPQGAVVEPRRNVNAHAGQAAGRHDAVAGTLHRVAECYLHFPEWRDRALALPGCEGTTYGTCFEPLSTRGPPEGGTKVYYDVVAFVDTKTTEDTVVIDVPLGPTAFTAGGNGKYGIAGRYRVSIDMRAWSQRRRLGFLRDVRNAMHRQQGLRDEGSKESILLFFLSAPAPNDATLFHVVDGRLACFLKGRQPARQRPRPKTGGRGAA